MPSPKTRPAAFVVVMILVLAPRPAAAQTLPPQIKIGADNGITAVFAQTPPHIDGIIDDEIWTLTTPAETFVQLNPNEGELATQPSAIRIAYDAENLYFGLSFYDSDPDLIRARNLERGGPNGNDDMFWLLIDTYDDDRNAYLFETNVLGTQDDAIITDEAMTRSDWQWDGIYQSEGRIGDDGWHVELAIPFKTIRFDNADELTMGVAIMRFLNRTGERSIWPFIPRKYSAGIFQVSQYATLTGIQNVEPGRNILIKPYVITGAQEFRVDADHTETDTQQDIGLDVKWAVNSSVTVDVTLNTDFAQVESDDVQLDLTRFNLFFPEKREFFLERAGLFEFGDSRTTETFFSRRIGISNDILAGARLVGQFDKLSVGVLNIQTGKNAELDLASANNTVVRVRGDVFQRTTVGAIVTNLERGDGYNRALGVDARRRFWGNSQIDGWYTHVLDSEEGASDAAGSVSLALSNADWQWVGGYTNVGKNFNPALGFVRRRDLKQYSASTTYGPQLKGEFFRSYSIGLSGSLANGQDNQKQSSDLNLKITGRFRARETISLELGRNFERLEDSFFIRPDAEIVARDYVSNALSFGFGTDSSKLFSLKGGILLEDYFGGDRTRYIGGIGLRTGRYLNLETGIAHNVFDIPIENGSFEATTFTLSANAATSRKLFAKALVQYDNFSGNLQANIRIDWIHSPGADLFVVFNTNYNFTGQEDQFDFRNALLNNRVGVAKLTYVLQM
ncbi:MAG: hypothetical protein ACI80V_000799 [Rhodothermales bacterium]|jgi:hypothetical protein